MLVVLLGFLVISFTRLCQSLVNPPGLPPTSMSKADTSLTDCANCFTRTQSSRLGRPAPDPVVEMRDRVVDSTGLHRVPHTVKVYRYLCRKSV